MAEPIEFHFDFISPYAYLGWKRAREVADDHGRILRPIPVLFAGLLNHWGQLGPAEIPPKREHLLKQIMRRAADSNLPVAPPPHHPFNPLLGLRVASLDMADEARLRVTDALFDATWATGHGIETDAAVAAVLDELGLDGATMVRSAHEPANKVRVREATTRAIERGIFGVPTVIVDGELFWGADDLDDVARFLDGADPVDPAVIEAWAKTRPSATRTRG